MITSIRRSLSAQSSPPPSRGSRSTRAKASCNTLCITGLVGAALACSLPACSSDDGASAPALVASQEARAEQENKVCWRASYGRGVGTIPTECPGADKSGLLCYPACKEGYYGVGPVCWQSCAEGYVDDGAFCRRPSPLHIYAKDSYGRGAGEVMSCRADQEKDAGLCYPRCAGEHRGVGPVCWKECPASHPVACGAGCATSSKDCVSSIGEQLSNAAKVIANAAKKDAAGAVEAAAKLAESLALPVCSGSSAPPAVVSEGDEKHDARDSCEGRADGIYCSQLEAYSSIVCKDQQIAGGQQCAEGKTCVGPNGPGDEVQCQ